MSKKRAKEKKFDRGSLNRRDQDGSRLFLTVEDTARFFNIDKSAVLDWIKLGVVPYHSLSGRIYFNKQEVNDYWTIFQTR
ncbi:MAG: helix-turn-helix domain-containing protein [Planctomycetota bacterium]